MTYFTARSNLVSFIWGKLLEKGLCLYKNLFVPKGFSALAPGAIYMSAPARGYIHMVKHEKNVYKIGHQSNFFKPATNGRSDKGFLLTSKVCPQGVVCPCPGAIYIYKSIKDVYKIRFRRDHFETYNIWAKRKIQRFFFKLATNGQSD